MDHGQLTFPPMRIQTSLLLALLTFPAIARADFTFVHVTDSHVSLTEVDDGNAQKDAAAFREIAALNPRPAFVAHTGDVCETATPREYAVWQKTLKELGDIPIHIAPGNHDVRWNPLGKEGYQLGTKQPLYHSWDYQNVHFVLLDPTVLLQHWGHFSRAQLDWLKADLAKAGTEKPVVIGFHHWVGRESVQVDNEQELLDLVAPYNVVLWLQGHGHADLRWNINGAPAIMAKGLYQGSYHLIEVTKDTMKVKRRSLGKAAGGEEILQDKTVPKGQKVVWTDLFTIPLTRRPAPKWSANATATESGIRLTGSAELGEVKQLDLAKPRLGLGKIEWRLDGGKFNALDGLEFNVPADGLLPGQHLVTFQLTTPDGRQYQKPAHVTIPGNITPAWSTNAGGAIQSHLVRANDALYVTTMGNDLTVLDPATGKEHWRFTAGDAIFSTPWITADTAYLASADHNVYAIDLKTHQPRWKFNTQGAVFAGPALAQGIVCVGSVDTIIYGLDAATGQEKWRVKGNNMYQSNTATDGNRFFVGGWDNTFRAIDARTGHVAWEKKIGRAPSGSISFYYSPAISSPAVGDGLVYVTTNDGVLHAFNTTTGDEAWSYDGKKLGYSSPLYHDGKVFCAIGDEGKTFAWDARTGKRLWETTVSHVIYDSSFTHSNGHLYIGSVDGTFNAIDENTGKLQYQYRLGPGHVFASPTADDTRVYIGSLSGQVTAFPTK
jgi:outer membrane protein assembly factor BamB